MKSLYSKFMVFRRRITTINLLLTNTPTITVFFYFRCCKLCCPCVQRKILLNSNVHDFVHDWAKSVKEEGFKEKPLWWLKSRKNSSGKEKNKRRKMVQLRPRAITVDRGSRGFGLSLIYRGLDKYEEKDTGIFVARVVPGGNFSSIIIRKFSIIRMYTIHTIETFMQC